ncbi:MAG: NRDE family protein [Deltaproteobacteria bacterium]|nr:NRDE family protein [Candidatus Anaeroferrophillacea bacterium]
MCTLLLAWRMDEHWPLIAGNNRDEFLDRTAVPPRLYHCGSGRRVSPRDRRAGGTWWAGNDRGMVVWLTNRWNGFDNDPAKRSRGAVVLDLISSRTPAAARRRLSALDPRDFNPFNVLVADRNDGFLFTNHPASKYHPLEPGFTYLGNGPIDDNRSMKASMAARLFAGLSAGDDDERDLADPPAAEANGADPPGGARPGPSEDAFLDRVWSGFQRLLRTGLPHEWLPPRGVNVRLAEYGTTSSTLLAVSAHPEPCFRLWYAPGNPLHVPYIDCRPLIALLSGCRGAISAPRVYLPPMS